MLAVMPVDITNFGSQHGLLKKLAIDLPPIMGSYGVVTRRDRPESPGAAAFLKHLRATLGRPQGLVQARTSTST
jgi:DNA-binding transcriptional LysR family regulator